MTAASIARQVGLGESEPMTGPQLAESDEASLERSAASHSVFARVTPAHKLRLVEAYQRRGEVVAVTGDGVNDTPALRRADVGVAMGRSGTEAAREAAEIVLTDDDFATIVAAIEEGRRIGDNVRKFVAFLLSANLGEVVLFAIAVLAGFGVPMSVVQVLTVNLVTDGLPAIALARDPVSHGTMQRKPRAPGRLFGRELELALAAAGVTIGLAATAAYLVGRELAPEAAQTMTFATVALAELAFVFSVRSPRTAAWRGPRNPSLVASVVLSSAFLASHDLRRSASRGLRDGLARRDRARDRARAVAVSGGGGRAGQGGAQEEPAMTAVAPETGIPRARPEAPAGAVRKGLVGRSFASVVDLAVCDGDRLVGLVPIERLLAAAAGRPLGELAQPAVRVRAGVDEEVAAARLARNGGRSLAVVGDDDAFVGLVTPRQAVTVLLREHEEDLARLGGFLSRSSQARTAAEEPVHRRLWHRLPWLALGLLGAMGSAGIVGAFEEQLSRQVLLAFFIPAVVYMADAVGTQTEALVIRGISVGVPGRRIVVRELTTGLVVGILLGAAFFPFAYLVWGDARIAATVALALLGSTATATLVAMALPYGLNRLGRDPAFGAGPLATVIQDLLSIVIYFAIALALTG